MSKKGKVVTIAALRAADAMGLTTKCLSAVLDVNEPAILKAGRFLLDPDRAASPTNWPFC